jgi:hypothetical protein
VATHASAVKAQLMNMGLDTRHCLKTAMTVKRQQFLNIFGFIASLFGQSHFF